MENVITRTRSPEEEELEKKLAELAVLEAELDKHQLELTTLQASLNAFEREYQRVVGVRYAELDKIETEIAKYLDLLKPKNSEISARYQQVWAKVQNHQQSNSNLDNNREVYLNSKPIEKIKKLYREVAKLIHPDFTTNKAECLRRHQLMAEVNQAYEKGDEAKLESILHKWQNSPESVQGEGIAADLIRSIRQIAQVRERLKTIAGSIESLKRSVLYRLREKAFAAQHEGRDLLTEMAVQVDEQIIEPKQRLAALKVRLSRLGL